MVLFPLSGTGLLKNTPHFPSFNSYYNPNKYLHTFIACLYALHSCPVPVYKL